MVERNSLDDVADEERARAYQPPVARGELAERPQAVR
jgi:hypothetical protein